MKLSHRILLMPAVAVLAFVGILTMSWLLGLRFTGLMVRIEQGYLPAVELSRDLKESLGDIQRGLQDAVASSDEQILEEVDAIHDEFLSLVESGRKIAILETSELDNLETVFGSYYTLARKTSLLMMSEEAGYDIVASMQSMSKQYNATKELLESFVVAQKEDMSSSFASATRQNGVFLRIAGLVILCSIVVLIVMSVLIVRAISKPINLVAGNIGAATAQIIASTTEQAATTTEQAATVSETTSTVEEVHQTARQTADRAGEVSEAAKRSSDIAAEGLRAAEETVDGMQTLGDQVSNIASTILDLSQKSQQIGAIIETVKDIAEQSGLLALNASIEAARAGESGKGFAVVAGEVSNLADQSTEATAKVREILGEIQKAANSAAMATEEGTKRAQTGMQLALNCGESLNAINDHIKRTDQAARQIAASASQQLEGMSQMAEAMGNINQAAMQNEQGTRQVANVADQLDVYAEELMKTIGMKTRNR